MKKILAVITTSFVQYGGLSSVMLNYYRAMDKTDLQIDFASTNSVSEALLSEVKSYGSSYVQLPARKNILMYILKLTSVLRTYDIVHIHSNSATATIELIAACFAGVKKRIVHNHNSTCGHLLIHSILKPLFLNLYTDALACSAEAGNWIFGKGNFILLKNAIDVSKYKYDEKVRNLKRKELELDNSFVVGHLGKMSKQKNHFFLLLTFAEILKEKPNAVLLLVGDGILRNDIEKQATLLKIKDRIRFVGMRLDTMELLNAMDVFVFPSLWEGLPLALLEAQSVGLPCFVSDKISKECIVSDYTHVLLLQHNANEWSTTILSESNCDRNVVVKVNSDGLDRSGFNIYKEAPTLRTLYLK